MSVAFLKIFNTSISASWIVFAVLVLRILFKKAPKWVSVCFWGIIGIKLICPFSFESFFSLVPSAETVSPDVLTDKTPQINTGIPILNNTINPIIENSVSSLPESNENIFHKIIPILSIIWLFGAICMALYSVFSYLRIKSRVRTAVKYKNNVYQSENVVSPFVLGIIKPKIYIPFNISEENADFVISHEKAHIKRRDHFWKPLGYALLTLHWFNPLIWVSYILLSRDIEHACDEKVIKNLNCSEKADYSKAILELSVNRKIISACPLAFGETNVKNRIKSVLNYKKCGVFIIVLAIISLGLVSVCFLTNPKDKPNNNSITILKSSSEFESVSLEYVEDNLDSTNPYLTLKWVNNSNETICFGEQFTIYKEDSVYLPSQENYFHLILSTLKPTKTLLQNVYLTSYDFENNTVFKLEKKFHFEGNKDKEYKASIEFSFNIKYSFTNQDYEVEEVIYRHEISKLEYSNPNISSMLYVENEKPQFKVLNDTLTLYEFPDYGTGWSEIGNLRKTILRESKFGKYFLKTNQNPEFNYEELIENNQNAFTINNNDFYIYYLLEQKNGDIYIFEGLGNNTFFNWGYKLKEYSGTSVKEDTINSNETSSNENIDYLKKKYPEFFGLDTFKGLEVYVGQLGSTSYSCILKSGKNSEYTIEEIWGDMIKKTASIEEMATIVSSYGLPKESITIIPRTMPHSSYHYVIDEEYKNRLEELFWRYYP